VKNEKITIEAQVPVCKLCNEEVFIPKYDDNNLKKAYDLYRQKYNLLSAERIALMRARYQLSQRAFAALIGCTQATINRYEKGAIPDSAYNALMRLMEKPENVKIMLNDRRSEMDVKDVGKLEELLERMINSANHLNSIFTPFMQMSLNPADEFSGFKKFDRNKMIAMVVFFAKKQCDLYKTKLMKLLWYADMLSFKQRVQSISGMKYVHQNFGPVPENHELILGILKAAGYIDLVSVREHDGEMVKAVADFDMECLSREELNILQRVNERFKNESATKISAISHKESGYINTEKLQFISYAYAEQLKEFQ